MIYLDYNATTPLCDEARAAMLPYLRDHFGNASSVHAAGREARAAIDNARDQLANLLGAKPHELIFTSGGTESNNLAVLGLARSRSARGKHLISCRSEHHAVLNALEHLEKREGFEVTWVDISQKGITDLDQLNRALRDDTALVTIMHANNETGVIQPLREISEICRARGVLLHSDMVQSFGKIEALNEPNAGRAGLSSRAERGGFEGSRGNNLKVASRDPSTPLRFAPEDGNWSGSRGSPNGNRPRDADGNVSLVDAASFAAHKFYGPKGAGFLYLRAGIPIDPINFGGAHENQRRPGTENVAAIAGMAAAAEMVTRGCTAEQAREGKLRDELWHEISARIPSALLNGTAEPRLANTLNVSFPDLDSETMLMALDLEGVCASSGSACMVGSVVASHVLLAMGLGTARAKSAVRFSLGRYTTADDITAAAGAVAAVYDRPRVSKAQTPSSVIGRRYGEQA